MEIMEYIVRFEDKDQHKIVTLRLSNWGGVSYLIDNLKKEKTPFLLLMHDIREKDTRTARALLDYDDGYMGIMEIRNNDEL